MADYHLHLHPHRPEPGAPPMGEYPPGWIERYVEAGLSRGVSELGFTEHFYRCIESEAVLGRWWERESDPRLAAEMEANIRAERNLSLDRYVDAVVDAKARGLPVKLGLEVDFEPGTEQAVGDLLSGYPFDYLVGSVHWNGAWDFMRSPPEAFVARGLRRVFEEYFDLATALAASGIVDVLGHADVIKRTALLSSGFDDLYQRVVAAVAGAGIAVEVSSHGLRTEAREIYPAPAFLALFHAAGAPITLASDAHRSDDAGWGHNEVVAAARAAGYTDYLRFEANKPLVTPLPEVRAAAT